MSQLRDILASDLRILIVAINPAPASANVGHPFSTPTNLFWRLLHVSGLTSRLYLPEEASRLPEDGLGLVSLVDRPTKAASELNRAEMRAGVPRLAMKVRRWRPRLVALLGLTLYPIVVPDEDEPGPGLKQAPFAGTRLFVLPNPSGRNRSYPGFESKLRWYRELSALCGERTPVRAEGSRR
jgi:TDG/mug DNA glycosylase family protein